MNNHAPGPWTWNQWGQTIGIDSKDYMNLAVLNPNGDHSKGIPDRFDVANARLIAAAPEMLEALQLWDQGFTEGEEFTSAQFTEWVNKNRRAARAAIQKATGAA